MSHGHSRNRRLRRPPSRTYNSWVAMVQRCTNPNYHGWSRYGGSGVKVCEAWREFTAFLHDMGERPEGMSLDRIDRSRDYEPGNCRWATPSEQTRNRSITKLSTALALEVRTRYADGATQRELAHLFNTDQPRISKIVRGEIWNH